MRDPASILALVAANLLPLAGVLWLGWDVAAVMLVYWMENLVTGVYAALKVACFRIDEPGIQVSKFFTVPFFCAHYGGFCAVHGLFILLIFNVGGNREAIIKSALGTSTWPLDLISGRLLGTVIWRAWKAAPEGLQWMLAALILSHGVSFVLNYLLRREYATVEMKDLMTGPYQRILYLHCTILAGGILALALGAPAIAVAVLVAIKIGVDVWAHIKSHERKPERV